MTAKWSRWRYLEARFVTILTIRFKGALVPAWPADRSPTRTGPVEADGAVDAQNAPTAPWKTLLVFHELPQGFPHPITHDKPRKSPESYWETRIDHVYGFNTLPPCETRPAGHAAPQGQQCADACGALERSVGLFVESFTLFQRPWAYLHQNFSRKYRVTPIAGDQSSFEHLKRETNHHHRPGVYVAFDGAISPVELMESDVDASDFLFANGQFKDNQYEVLSYTTNSRRRVSAERFLTTTEPLPQSHTQGTGRLDVVGNAFVNLPPLSRGYVERARLEADLVEQLSSPWRKESSINKLCILAMVSLDCGPWPTSKP